MEENQIQQILDKVTGEIGVGSHLRSVVFSYNRNLVEVTLEKEYLDTHKANLNRLVVYKDDKLEKEIRIKVEYLSGPEIITFEGYDDTHLPLRDDLAELPIMGGDRCQNAIAGGYGTITVFLEGIEYELRGGPCRREVCAENNRPLISCNHVIARSDRGSRDEIITHPQYGPIGRLSCYMRFSCQTSTDFATARSTFSQVALGQIRGIGRITGARRPIGGEHVRKYGARTLLTDGNVTGQVNLNTRNGLMRNVFQLSRGFACPGDSGSGIISDNNDLLGILSWGEHSDCNRNPFSYFWTLNNPGQLLNLTGISTPSQA